MKYLTFTVLSLLLMTQVYAEEQNSLNGQQTESNKKPAESSQVARVESNRDTNQKHDPLKTQFLGKRPYMEKVAK